MAQLSQRVTGTPMPIAGLTAGTRYILQALNGAVWIEDAASAPSVGSETAFRVPSGGSATIHFVSGEAAYVWRAGGANDDYNQRVVLSEVLT